MPRDDLSKKLLKFALNKEVIENLSKIKSLIKLKNFFDLLKYFLFYFSINKEKKSKHVFLDFIYLTNYKCYCLKNTLQK